jgi:hypothetical protein
MATSDLRHDVKTIDRPPGVRLYRGSAMVVAAVVLALVFNAANAVVVRTVRETVRRKRPLSEVP